MKKNTYLDYGSSSTLETKLSIIKNCGFDGVFLWYYSDPKVLEEVVTKTRCFSLEIESFHLPYQNINSIWFEGSMGDDIVKTMIEGVRAAAQYNVKIVVMHLVGGMVRPLPNEIGLRRIKEILSACEEYDVYLALENVKDIKHIDYVYKHIESQYLKFCFDFGHVNCFAPTDYKIDLSRYAEKIICVHIHDNNGQSDQHLIPFTGTVDYNYMMNELKKIGYSGPLTSEAKIKNHPDLLEDQFISRVYATLEQLERL